jgi:hypothetical protein
MLAATLLGVFLIPSLFVIAERIARSERKLDTKLSRETEEGSDLPLAEGAR